MILSAGLAAGSRISPGTTAGVLTPLPRPGAPGQGVYTKDLPYYRLWVKDFDTDESVRMLNLPELGLFLLCLNHAWVNNGLPADPKEISRTLKIPTREFNRHWPRVGRCFAISPDGRLHSSRQEEERAQARIKSVKAKESANHRWEDDANASKTHSEGNARTYDSVSVADSGSGFDSKKETSLQPILDDFGRYVEACQAAELPASETDWKAARFEWQRLDFQQKLDAVQGLKDRIAAGELADPGFRPLPQNYLKQRIWQRPVRVKRVEPGSESVNDRALKILKRNLMSDRMAK